MTRCIQSVNVVTVIVNYISRVGPDVRSESLIHSSAEREMSGRSARGQSDGRSGRARIGIGSLSSGCSLRFPGCPAEAENNEP